MRVSLLVKIAVPLVIVAALGGYFATRYFAKSDSRFTALSLAGTTREYRTEATSLRLAPGWRWPVSPVPRVASDGRGIRYEKGWGKQAADYYWYCSWTSRAVDPALSAAGRKNALEQVLSIRDKYYFTTALAPNSKPLFNQVLKKAAAGDVRALRRDYELNCPRPVTGGAS